MTDLLHLVGIVPYDRKQTKKDVEKARESRLLNGNRKKAGANNIFELREKKLSQLGAEDLDIIAVAEDENARSGDWTRIFPCADMTQRYLPLFEFPRYKNTVLAKWMEKPDWSLLAPMFSPALPPNHKWRQLAAQHAMEKAERAAQGGGTAAALRRALEAKREGERLLREQQKERQHEELHSGSPSHSRSRAQQQQQLDEENRDREAVERARAALFEPLGEAKTEAERAASDGEATGVENAARGVNAAMPAVIGCATGEAFAACATVAGYVSSSAPSAPTANGTTTGALVGVTMGSVGGAAESGSAAAASPVGASSPYPRGRWDLPMSAHSSHLNHGLSIGFTAAVGSASLGASYGATTPACSISSCSAAAGGGVAAGAIFGTAGGVSHGAGGPVNITDGRAAAVSMGTSAPVLLKGGAAGEFHFRLAAAFADASQRR